MKWKTLVAKMAKWRTYDRQSYGSTDGWMAASKRWYARHDCRAILPVICEFVEIAFPPTRRPTLDNGELCRRWELHGSLHRWKNIVLLLFLFLFTTTVNSEPTFFFNTVILRRSNHVIASCLSSRVFSATVTSRQLTAVVVTMTIHSSYTNTRIRSSSNHWQVLLRFDGFPGTSQKRFSAKVEPYPHGSGCKYSWVHCASQQLACYRILDSTDVRRRLTCTLCSWTTSCVRMLRIYMSYEK